LVCYNPFFDNGGTVFFALTESLPYLSYSFFFLVPFFDVAVGL